MKKLLLITAMGITGLLSAGQTLNSFIELEMPEAVAVENCIHVKLTCNVEYDVCNFSGTNEQLINSILNANNNVCGTNFEMLPVEP